MRKTKKEPIKSTGNWRTEGPLEQQDLNDWILA